MSSLILIRNGRETPAPGRWTIAPGQPVCWVTGHGWRKRTSTGRTTAGGLLLDPAGPAAFRLSVHATAAIGLADHIDYQSFSINDDTLDSHWQVDGEVLWAGRVIPARSVLVYHGVFRTGAGAVAWLGWQTRIALGRTGGKPTRIRLSAELNLEAPAAPLDQKVRLPRPTGR